MAGILVGDVMMRAVVTVKKNDTLDKVTKTMAKANIASVVVLEKGRVVGILTDKDIVRDILAKGKSYKTIRVGSVMKSPVRTIPPDTDVEQAMRIMRDLEISKLPVVGKANKLVGIITERDLMRIEPALHHMMREKASIDAFGVKEKTTLIAGECEICGNYSEFLRNVNGQFICEDCR